MVLRLLTAACTVGVLVVTGCSGESPPAGQSAPVARKEKRPEAASPGMEDADAGTEEIRYDPTGKPDPFRSFVKAFLSQLASDSTGPLERFDLSQLHVSAIVWGLEDPRALISDPTGKGYIVSEGTAIGKNRGRVVRIDDNLVLVKETYVDFHGKATTKDIEMRLHPIQGG